MIKKTFRSLAVTSLATVLATVMLTGAATLSFAGKADVVKATAQNNGNTWSFSATVRHADDGWKHYANSFQVLSMKGEVLGTRILEHPHVNEQPFTRSLSHVNLPKGTVKVRIRAGDSVHGYGGKEVVITLQK